MTPRGLRNNNCLNIRKSNDKWEGMSQEQPDKDFVCFITPEWGIRAAYRILCTYNIKYHCKTIGQIISRWAPPNENDTVTYLRFVCNVCKCEPEAIIDINDTDFMCKLIKAMCKMENGSCPYSDPLIKKGISLKDARYVA